MAKRRTIGNPKGKKGKTKPVPGTKPGLPGLPGLDNKLPFESIILCDIAGGSDEFRSYYLTSSRGNQLSKYDPGQVEDREAILDDWKKYVAHRQLFETFIVNIITVGGSITLGKTMVTIMDQSYIIKDEQYKFDPENMILRRIMRLVKVEPDKLN